MGRLPGASTSLSEDAHHPWTSALSVLCSQLAIGPIYHHGIEHTLGVLVGLDYATADIDLLVPRGFGHHGRSTKAAS